MTPSPQTTPIALTIAGSDSSGGAGIQADIKTFTVLGVYGASVLTALTAQNTRGVGGIHAVPPAFIAAQFDAVVSDLAIGATKTGMLGDLATVVTVARLLRECPPPALVVDPVMVATSGDVLLEPPAIDAVRRELLPLADLVTPNLPEAAHLLGAPLATDEATMEAQARALLGLGPRAVLIKGGHGRQDEAVDILVTAAGALRLARPRLPSASTHGTGCTLSAAITAHLARGAPLAEAIQAAKSFVWDAIAAGAKLAIGAGSHPIDHLHGVRSFAGRN